MRQAAQQKLRRGPTPELNQIPAPQEAREKKPGIPRGDDKTYKPAQKRGSTKGRKSTAGDRAGARYNERTQESQYGKELDEGGRTERRPGSAGPNATGSEDRTEKRNARDAREQSLSGSWGGEEIRGPPGET